MTPQERTGDNIHARGFLWIPLCVPLPFTLRLGSPPSKSSNLGVVLGILEMQYTLQKYNKL